MEIESDRWAADARVCLKIWASFRREERKFEC